MYQYPTQSSSWSPYSSSSSVMSVSGIQGQLLEVTVVGCNKLKDTEWLTRQDPYVCLEYASTKHRTRTHTDGGKTPTFQEKFVIPLIEGLREINVHVWNSNSVSYDDFIGEGKVQLQKVLSQGYDDGAWSLQTKTGRYAGEVRLIMHYTKNESMKPNKPSPGYAPSAPPYGAPNAHMYPTPPPPYPPQPQTYAPPPPAAYPAPSPYPSYPPNPSYSPNLAQAGYPPYGAPSPSAYPPAPYPPTSTYPYPPSTYPPPPQNSPFYPPSQGPYGTYPPPPY